MIRGKKKVLENYSDKDLQSFETLKNFSKYNVNIIQTNYRQHSDQTERYNSSDNEKFMKLMNSNKNIKNFSTKYSINDFSNNYDLPKKRKDKKNDSFYNKSDMQNFENLKQFFPISSLDSSKYSSKQEDSTPVIINYTDSDLKAFERIVKLNEVSTNKQITVKNDDVNNLESKIDISSIKIIDFDKLKKRETLSSKKRIKKIKVVYFN